MAEEETSAVAPLPSWRHTVRSPFGTCAWAFGLMFWWFSLYPTILPRSPMMQGVISALCLSLGLATGTLVAWLTRSARNLAGRPALGKSAKRNRRLLFLLAVILIVIGLPWWVFRQNSQRGNVTMDVLSPSAVLWVVIFTLLVTALLIVVGRSIVVVVRLANLGVQQVMPRPLGSLLGILTIVVVVAITIGGFATSQFVGWANQTYGTFDTTTPEGIEQPTSSLRSGGPGSLVAWDTLGYEGRNFAGGGPTKAELQSFAGPAAKVTEPIRVYVGIDSVDMSSESESLPIAQADVAVAELDRTGAFDRSVLAIVTVTGTGWVDPYFSSGLEYMNNGDTAIVATQYSFLPSWISFLVDLDKASANGKALVDAVVAKWSTLPIDNRPRLVVYGESLGSYGSENAFVESSANESINNALSQVDGVLWAGPTFANPLWKQIKATRNANSPVWDPIGEHDGRVAIMGAPDQPPVASRLAERSIVYLTHPSDPVTWASVDSLWAKPPWMNAPRGVGVAAHPLWFPGVTFIQEVFDLMAGFSAPPGFGHNYDANTINGVASIAAPDGWSGEKSAQLADLLATTLK